MCSPKETTFPRGNVSRSDTTRLDKSPVSYLELPVAVVKHVQTNEQITETVWCTGKEVEGVIDTGAVVTSIIPKLAKDLNLKVLPWDVVPVVIAGCQKAALNGRAEITVPNRLGKASGSDVVFHTYGTEMISGRDLLAQFEETTIIFRGTPELRLGELPWEQ